MLRAGLVFIGFCLLLPTHLPAQTTSAPTQVARVAARSVVSIEAIKAGGGRLRSGFGFFLADGRIVTHGSVLSGAESVQVVGRGGIPLGRRTYAEAVSPSSGVVILSALGASANTWATGVRFAEDLTELGDQVWMGCSPEGRRGTVATLQEDRIPIFFWLGWHIPEYWGCPVLDDEGKLVGVLTFEEPDEVGGNSVSEAVWPVASLDSLSQRAPVEVAFASLAPAPRVAPRPPNPWFGKLSDAAFLRLGQAVHGFIDTGRFSDVGYSGDRFFRFIGKTGGSVTIKVSSTLLPLSLTLLPPSCVNQPTLGPWACEEVTSNAADGMRRNLQISVPLPEDGQYLLRLRNWGGRGRYSLELSEGTQVSPETHPDRRWSRISGTDDAAVAIDSTTVIRSDSSVVAWFRWEYESVQTDNSHRSFDTHEFLYEIRCGSRQSRLIQFAKLFEGEVVDSNNLPEAEWSYGRPGSVGEGMVEEACRLAGVG